MSYIALYRKWRPLTFEDVVWQQHVVSILKNSVVKEHISHAYLFCGTRGTGKTTMAKVFARAINCLEPQNGSPCNKCESCLDILAGSSLDVLEIDAASNNSVDNVREIRDEIVYTPAKGKYKVYIIDEVHMLSAGAFNALLKTLEEPPSYAVFILATTEPHKLPATILSRCQRFEFKRIPVDVIAERLTHIAVSSGVELKNDAAFFIAGISDGALRDAISILDQCMSFGKSQILYDDVLAVTGNINSIFLTNMICAIHEKNIKNILELVKELIESGKNISNFVSDIVLYYRSMLIYKVSGKFDISAGIDENSKECLKQVCEKIDKETLIFIIKELSFLEASLKWALHSRVLLEIALIKLCESKLDFDVASISERLSKLEKKIDTTSVKPVIKQNQPQELLHKNKVLASNASKKPDEPKEKKLYVKGVLDIWQEVLKDLKSNGKMALHANLLDSTVYELEAGVFGIAFEDGNSFNRIFVSRTENIEIIETAISSKLGKNVRVKCIDGNYDKIEKKEAKEDDGLIEKAQNIASMLNVPLNIIDE